MHFDKLNDENWFINENCIKSYTYLVTEMLILILRNERELDTYERNNRLDHYNEGERGKEHWEMGRNKILPASEKSKLM